jgi:hypothetical protein
MIEAQAFEQYLRVSRSDWYSSPHCSHVAVVRMFFLRHAM